MIKTKGYTVFVKGFRASGVKKRYYAFRAGLTLKEAEAMVAAMRKAGHEAKAVAE